MGEQELFNEIGTLSRGETELIEKNWYEFGDDDLTPVIRRPPTDAREEIPTLEVELRHTFEGIAEDRPPTTALHALVASQEPLTIHQITFITGLERASISWTLEMLEEANLVFRFDNEYGIEKFALYTQSVS
jgi:DNA-binding transcriptional ArsR family regulator